MWLILILAAAGVLGYFVSRWWNRRQQRQSASTMIIDSPPTAGAGTAEPNQPGQSV